MTATAATAPAIIYLSPHADDVALSCGASAAADAAGGAQVTILTVFSAGADSERRGGEDRAAAAILGCALGELALPDAPGRPEVRGLLGLFDPLSGRHLGVLSEVVARLRQHVPAGARLVAPLGVGGHIDHRLTQAAAQALGEERPLALSYYEDLPYARARHAIARRLAALSARLGPHAGAEDADPHDPPARLGPGVAVAPAERTALLRRGTPAEEGAAYRRYLEGMPLARSLAPPGLRGLALRIAARAAVAADRPGHAPGFPPRLAPRVRAVEEFAARRLAASAAYVSQWPLLFPSLPVLERELRAHGGGGDLRERFWDVVPRGPAVS